MRAATRCRMGPSVLVVLAGLMGCGGAIGTEGDGGVDLGDTTDGLDTAADSDAQDPVQDDAAVDPRPDPPVDPIVDPVVEDSAPDVVEVVDTVEDPEPDGSCPLQVIPFEAEAMTLDDGFRTGWSDYLSDQYIISLIDNDGQASIVLDIPCTDSWVLWATVWWESGYSDSFYFAWDDPADLYVWHVMQQCMTYLPRGWYYDQVSRSPVSDVCDIIDEDPAVMPLSMGTHTFHLMGREDGAAVAAFFLTNDLAWTPE